jgi:hypothetical protein
MLDYVDDSQKFLKEELPLFEKRIFGIRIWEFLRYAIWKDLQRDRSEGLNLSRSAVKKFGIVSNLKQIRRLTKLNNQWVLSNRIKLNGSNIFDPAIGQRDFNSQIFVLDQGVDDSRIINLSELNRLVDLVFSIFSFFPALLAAFYFRIKILDHCVSKKLLFLRLTRCLNWLIFWRFLIWLTPGLTRVIVNTHYSMQAHTLLWITNRLGIVFDEYQHGTLGKSHLAYNSLFAKKLWPSKLFVWGDAWVRNMNYTGNMENCVKPRYKMYPDTKEIDVLFIGQAREDVKLAYTKFHKENPNLRVAYLPHPQEVSEEFRTADSYEIVAKSLVVIGVWSTMLIEALHYNCIVWRMALPFHEVLDDFNIPILQNLSFDDMLNWEFSEAYKEYIWNG